MSAARVTTHQMEVLYRIWKLSQRHPAASQNIGSRGACAHRECRYDRDSRFL